MNFFDFDKMNRLNTKVDFDSDKSDRFEFCNKENADQRNNNCTNGMSQGDVMKKFCEYSNKSQSELYAELISTVQKMKKDGTLDMAQLYSFYNVASAYLDDDQRQRMKGLIDTIGHQL